MKRRSLPLNLKKSSVNPWPVVLPYVIVSGLWIFFSDGILPLFTQDLHRISVLSMYKGWTFVFVTGVMLYFLVRGRSAKLKASNESFRMLFNSMAQGVVYQDSSGRITLANPAAEEILGLKLEALKSLADTGPILRTVYEDGSEFPRSVYPFVIAMNSGKPVKNVVVGFSHPGISELRWILIDSVPQFMPNESVPFQVFSTFTNITERKKTEEVIIDLNKTLEQRVIERTSDLESFTYSVAHDLRAPLRGIDGFTGILEEDYAQLLDEAGTKVMHKIRENVVFMDKLMDALLEFSRMGRSEMQETDFNMSDIIEDCYHKLTTEEQRAIIGFKLDAHCLVHADRSLMFHVWSNLLSNALKFSANKEKPEITIKCSRENNELVFSIRDNGAGFDMRYKDKLFGVFQRLHSVREFSGTGVGLAIVHRIIQRHGGRIWAESEVDKGATFYFTLGR